MSHSGVVDNISMLSSFSNPGGNAFSSFEVLPTETISQEQTSEEGASLTDFPAFGSPISSAVYTRIGAFSILDQAYAYAAALAFSRFFWSRFLTFYALRIINNLSMFSLYFLSTSLFTISFGTLLSILSLISYPVADISRSLLVVFLTALVTVVTALVVEEGYSTLDCKLEDAGAAIGLGGKLL